MRGDVWVAINKNGEKVLHIDNGKFVSKKVIDKPQVRYNIVQPKNNQIDKYKRKLIFVLFESTLLCLILPRHLYN